MNLKTILYEINYQSEIIDILRNVEAKIDNIKFLWDALNEYKKQLNEVRIVGDFQYYEKINNVYKISSFVEDMALNSYGATKRDFETLKRELRGEFKNVKEFINDWQNIEKILHDSLQQTEVLEEPELSNEQLNLINYEQETNIQTECFSTKKCIIL